MAEGTGSCQKATKTSQVVQILGYIRDSGRNSICQWWIPQHLLLQIHSYCIRNWSASNH